MWRNTYELDFSQKEHCSIIQKVWSKALQSVRGHFHFSFHLRKLYLDVLWFVRTTGGDFFKNLTDETWFFFWCLENHLRYKVEVKKHRKQTLFYENTTIGKDKWTYLLYRIIIIFFVTVFLYSSFESYTLCNLCNLTQSILMEIWSSTKSLHFHKTFRIRFVTVGLRQIVVDCKLWSWNTICNLLQSVSILNVQIWL